MSEIISYSKIEQLVNLGTKNINDTRIKINNNKPKFNKKDYNIEVGEIKYFDLDNEGRITGAIALISKTTAPLPDIIEKEIKYPNPHGWTKSLEGKRVFERCHIIAYSMLARITDKRNVFIGTETLNISIMNTEEIEIKSHIEETNDRVLYRVTIKYKGIDKIPTGILIEAKGLDTNFEKCVFCYNIQNDVRFHYKDGKILEDSRIVKSSENNKNKKATAVKVKQTEDKQNFVIDRRENKFHLMKSNCSILENIEPEYINETTTKKSNLIKAGLTPCKECL